ncbi:hypothetical protein QTP88_002963 [Uroleucon formosanum]
MTYGDASLACVAYRGLVFADKEGVCEKRVADSNAGDGNILTSVEVRSMGKSTTPNNTTTTSIKVVTRSTSSIPPSNSDIMAALDKLRGEVVSANKNITSTQTLQFEELKNDLKQLSLQIIELKAENTTLRSELDILKCKVMSLKDAGSPSQSSHFISQVLQESFERQRCSLNTIIYGVPESSSASPAQRISDDSFSIRNLFEPHSIVIPDNSKVIHLGKVVAGKSRPIKLLCGSINDKTLMQRTLLRSCHAELENRKLNGESNLEISYVNGAPQKKAHAKFKSTFNPDNYRHFSLLRARYNNVSKKLYHEFVDRTDISINANPSNFWKFIKKQRYNSDIPKTLTLNGASSTNEQDSADMFASYFKSVYSCEDVNNDVNDLKIRSFDLSYNAYFTVDDVFHSLSTLSDAKNVGPDDLPGVFLFHLSVL